MLAVTFLIAERKYGTPKVIGETLYCSSQFTAGWLQGREGGTADGNSSRQAEEGSDAASSQAARQQELTAALSALRRHL